MIFRTRSHFNASSDRLFRQAIYPSLPLHWNTGEFQLSFK